MDKENATSTADEKVEGKKPVKTFRSGNVSASIFAFEREVKDETIITHSTLFSRSYKDRDGQRQWAKGFQTDDMPNLILVSFEVSQFLRGLGQNTEE
jgi:hypothetical protein